MPIAQTDDPEVEPMTVALIGVDALVGGCSHERVRRDPAPAGS
jgi:hypothetical protein